MPSRNWCDSNSPWAAQIQAAGSLTKRRLLQPMRLTYTKPSRCPGRKNSWKSLCKNAVKCHWSNKMLTNASQKSTLKHIVWNKWIEQAHGIWRVCRERPFLLEATKSRARILVGRLNIQASSWKKHKGEDPRCPVCEEEEEDIQRLLVTCPVTHAIREERILEIRDLYKAEKKRPPRSWNEVCSAIINRESYVMDEERNGVHSQARSTK